MRREDDGNGQAGKILKQREDGKDRLIVGRIDDGKGITNDPKKALQEVQKTQTNEYNITDDSYIPTPILS